MLPMSRRRLRVILGALWLLDAALQAQPHFFTDDWWHDDLPESVMGQPAALSHSILWVTGLLAAHPVAADTIAIVIQAAIGLCLILGRFPRAAIAVSIPWALSVWWIGEGFGALATGFAQLAGGAPGPAPLYAVIGILAWPKRSDGAASSERGVAALPALTTWLVVWAGSALLELPWRFAANRALQADIEQNNLGQPHWLAGVAHASYQLVGSHPLLTPAVLLVAQLGIGLGVIPRRIRPYALAAGTAAAILFWVTAQDLGGLASGPTDPGTGPLLVLLAATAASAVPTGRNPWRSVERPILLLRRQP